MTSEQQRILTDLHKGSAGHPADKYVYVRAGDVIQLCNALWSETQRADVAEAKLAADEGTELDAPAAPRS